MPATPVLSNGGTQRGLPISCFLNEASDSLDGIVGLWNENVWLASKGGGIGSYWGNLRSIGERVGAVGKTLRRDPVHPGDGSADLGDFAGPAAAGLGGGVFARCGIRRSRSSSKSATPDRGRSESQGAEPAPRHPGAPTRSCARWRRTRPGRWSRPRTTPPVRTISARRTLWIRILTARIEETGEPYLIFSDHAKAGRGRSITSWPGWR